MKAVGLFINLTHCYWERFSPWQKYSLLGGVCWQYQWWVFPFVFQDAPNTRSRGKAFRSLPHHRPIRHHLSRLLCCFLPWLKAAALWYELLFLHVSLSIACVQLTQEKKPLYSLPCSYLWRAFLSLCCVCAQHFGRAGKGGLRNYKAHQT